MREKERVQPENQINNQMNFYYVFLFFFLIIWSFRSKLLHELSIQLIKILDDFELLLMIFFSLAFAIVLVDFLSLFYFRV